MSSVLVRAVVASDAARLVEIYNHYVLHTAISFEEAVISAADMAVRIDKVLQLKLPWLVAERDGGSCGDVPVRCGDASLHAGTVATSRAASALRSILPTEFSGSDCTYT